MSERDLFAILREDIEIPEVVQNKVDSTLEQIMNEQKVTYPAVVPKKRRRNYTKIAIAIFAATMLLGTVTVCAEIYKKWSKGLEKELHIDETDKIVAESTELAQFQNISVEDAGVTVTAQQSLVDNYTAFLSFRVEGFEIEKYAEPEFEQVTVKVDGQTVNIYRDFYDNLIPGEDGRVVMSDGSEVPRDENGRLMITHLLEDGSLEYRILLTEFKGEKGSFFNKIINIQFKDLGIITQKAEMPEIQIEGNWEFEWELKGCESIYEKETDAPLGDTGATVKYIEISQISLNVIYAFKREITWETTMVGDEELNVGYYNEPPRLLGVKLKDGTLLPYENMGGGLDGFISDTEYRMCFMTDRILNVDEIEALLFYKDSAFDSSRNPEEDMYYIVSIR